MSEDKDAKGPVAIGESEAEKVSGGRAMLGDDVYKCSKCGRSFSTASLRNAHQSTCTH